MTNLIARFLPERVRERLGQRTAGFILALLVEGLLLFLLLALNHRTATEEREYAPMSTFNIDANADEAPAPREAEAQQEQQQQASPPDAPPPPPQARPDTTPPARVPPALLPFTREQMAEADISNLPSRRSAPAANGPVMGPPAPASTGRGDTARVGTAPNGQPMYAAAWYREPYPDELNDYLATASGPGWALIACRTVPNYRVEDCELLDEYPTGSNIGRSVLAAAWQFQVRPPWRGGESLVGSWVRIRIDYTIRRR